jgi:hypothetical protein
MNMGMKDPRVGFNSVTEFMGSGLPWVITSTATDVVTRHSFEKITKHVIIHNLAASGVYLRVGFTENGINGVGASYYYKVNGGQVFEFDARIKEVFILRDGATSAAYSLYAELTNIDSFMMPILTGSLNGSPFWNGIG